MQPPWFLYLCNLALLIGFALPLLSLLLGFFGSLFGGGGGDAATDPAFDLDLDLDAAAAPDALPGAGHGGPIPFNLMCVCLALIVFGASGHMAKRFMTSTPALVLLFALCAALAAIAYRALFLLLIRRLRDNDASAPSFGAMRGKRGEVTLRIEKGAVGTISVTDETGGYLSFRARHDPDLADTLPDVIERGKTVVITDTDAIEKVCYISLHFKEMT